MVCDSKRFARILLNQQYGNALLIDIFDDRHNIVYDQGRKAKRRFIEQQDLWFAHQSSGDCQHLLFPAGHGSGPLFLSLIQPRKHFIGALEARCAILDRIAAEEQIFLNSQIWKYPSALGDQRNSLLHHLIGCRFKLRAIA